MTNQDAPSREALRKAGFAPSAGAWSIAMPVRANLAADTVGIAAAHEPDRPALTFEDLDGRVATWTFRELDHVATSLAAALQRLGVQRGQPVGIHTGQSPETAFAHLALHKLGAVAVTLSQLYGPDTISHIVADCGLSLAFSEGLGAPGVRTIGAAEQRAMAASAAAGFASVDTAADDPALLMYTSGSTGMPKGLLHAHRILHAYMPTVRLFYDLSMDDPDAVFWTPADWAWVGGLLDLVLPAWAARRLVVASPHRFDAAWALDFMARHRVTHTFMTPTALKRLAEIPDPHAGRDLRLKVICTGGESLPGEVVRWAEQSLRVVCNEFYGLTEFNHLVGNCRRLYPIRAGSMGRAYPGHGTAIVDEEGRPVPNGDVGEVVAPTTDPTLFLGYWGQPGIPERMRLGPWLRTGDLARRDDQGYFWYQGRNDDLIKSAGYRIGPAEVEDCLMRHPAVAEAAVIASPDPARGSIVKALVRLSADVRPSDDLVRALQDHVRSTLAAYKFPREIEFVDGFPLTSSGKIRRGELRRLEAERKATAR